MNHPVLSDPLEQFFSVSPLTIQQDIQSDNPEDGAFKSWIKYTGYATPHKYTISQGDKVIGKVVEDTSGKVPFAIKHAILKHRRPCRFDVRGVYDQPLFSLYRPFSVLISDLRIQDEGGQPIAFIKERFPLLSKEDYQLFSAKDLKNPFATIVTSSVLKNTFEVLNRQNKPIGSIKKKWQGMLKEISTYADTFLLKWDSGLSLREKITLFSACISIDFDYFERHI